MVYLVSLYVPVEYSEKVKQAMFDAGAGKYNNYDSCSWECVGTGQFKPLEGSDPFIGKQHVVERVEELKVEMICRPESLKAVVAALKEAHPYEEPAYHCIPAMTASDIEVTISDSNQR